MFNSPVGLFGVMGALEKRTPLKLSCLTGSESALRSGDPADEDLLSRIRSRPLSRRGVNMDCIAWVGKS